jgi:hypothetical protein
VVGVRLDASRPDADAQRRIPTAQFPGDEGVDEIVHLLGRLGRAAAVGEVVRLERIFPAVVEFVVEFAAWSGDPFRGRVPGEAVARTRRLRAGDRATPRANPSSV